MENVQQTSKLGSVLEYCQANGATDLHCRAGHPYSIRVHGNLSFVPTEQFPVPNQEDIRNILSETFSTETCVRIQSNNEVDLSFYHGNHRYRANFSKQKGLQSFSFRSVPQHRLKLGDLQLPESLKDLVKEPRGLVLVTGPTGHGKSTTLRALLQEVNETQAARVVTIEDPIEYVFEDSLSQFEQREVGIDTASFADGIRNAMRQDPDVIFVGEIRDRESIFVAMQAAETGHLVLTTLHADSVAQAIARIREYYPGPEQSNVSSLLSRNLNTIICQRLVPNQKGTRTPCLEIMNCDRGVQEAILNNDLELLTGIIEVSLNQGMHTFDQYLTELLAADIISIDTANHFAVNKHKLEMTLRGIDTPLSILKPDKNP